jgi:hypothetical protein
LQELCHGFAWCKSDKLENEWLTGVVQEGGMRNKLLHYMGLDTSKNIPSPYCIAPLRVEFYT